MGSSGIFTTHTRSNLALNKNGYLYVYVSNETPNIDVFFDNLQVTHIRGPLIEETHYYPFGLTMSGISSKALNFGDPEDKRKYNGIEKENDLHIEIYDAQLRELDGQIGRWWEVDPETENMEGWSPYASNYDNPILNSDPLGNEPECCGFLQDVWNGITEKAEGAWNAVTHPVETVKNAFTWESIKNNALDVVTYGLYGDTKTLVNDGPGKLVGGKIFDAAAYVVTDGIAKGLKVDVKTPEAKVPEVKAADYSNLKDSKSVGPGKPFTPVQKKAIINENMKQNGGQIKSDASGKVADKATQSKKGVKANMNQAEVDHKIRKARGSNSAQNAQILTKEENLKKSNN